MLRNLQELFPTAVLFEGWIGVNVTDVWIASEFVLGCLRTCADEHVQI
jgi:hypothetical protein